MKKLLLIFILIAISTCSLYSQYKTIKGRVITNQLDTINYVEIIINDSIVIGKANMNGFFKINIPVSVKKMLFKGPGLEPALIKLNDNCDDIEIIMLLSSSDDYMPLKKSDEFRKKRLKQLQELHRKAFTQGLFKSDKICYSQEFIAYYYKKRN